MQSIVAIAQNAQFIGQKVDRVLATIGRAFDDYLFVDFDPGHLTGAAFHFESEGWLYVYIDDCQHQPCYSAERKWDLDKFRQEHIASMEWEED